MDPTITGSPQTIVDVLRRHVAQRGDQTVYTFLADGQSEQDSWTFAEVDRRARAIAAHLQDQGMTGQRALLLFHPGLEFIAAFLGCLYAGTVAVPAYPPASKRHWPRLRSIVEDAQPHWALTASPELSKIRRVSDKLDELADLQWLATDSLDLDRAAAWQPPAIDGDSLAFLQYTSGSTSTPKGVMVSHGNLLHNEEVIRRGFGLDASAVIVGWLPLYHDMGLIGNLLQPLYLGARLVFMGPVAFLQQPIRWLQAISKYRATTSGGPNFAYDLCCQRIDPEQAQDLDLSTWKVAFSGAEPVRAETLRRFAETFASCGFQHRAFYPCYGMAETTLMTTGGDPAEPPVIQTFDAQALEANRAVPLTDTDSGADGDASGGRPLVGCGHHGWDLEVVIADPADGSALADGRVGEIWVCGDSVAQGYWQRPEANDEVFGARLAGAPERGPYLRTGDLGFLAEGQLFVTGRAKDLIILRGRNHYPQDIERTAELSHGDLRAGSGAAVSVEIDGEERLVIIYEVERHTKDDPEIIAEAVRRQVSETHEVQVHEVVLIRVATVPKTSSGKIQRHACRQEYLDGTLTVVGNSRLASLDTAIGAEVLLSREALLATEVDERASLLQAFLADRVARLAKIPRAGIDPAAPLTGIGLDSLTSVQLKNDIEERLGLVIPLETLLDGASLQQLAAALLVVLEEGTPALPFDIADPAVTEHPLSHGQRALWYLHRLDARSAAYNISGAARLETSDPGEGLDAGRLEAAARHLVKRHAVLRTTYHPVDGEPRARVSDSAELDFLSLDADGWSDGEIHRRLTAEAERPFDLQQGPVLRLVVCRRSQDSHLLIALHHIAGDFWSLALLLRELAHLYGHAVSAAEDAAEDALQPLEATYADFVAHQAKKLQGDSAEDLWSYWRTQLGGELPALDLPTDRPRPAVQTFAGALTHRDFDAATVQGLRQLAKQQGVTLYMLLLTLYQMLLQRYSGQDDLLVGSPFTLRNHAALEPLVGYFVNPLVLRGDLSGDPRCSELLAENRATVLQAFAHRDAPFPWLTERLALSHDTSRSPVFQTLFVLQNDRSGEEGVADFSLGKGGARLPFGQHTLESVPLARRSAQFDLTLQVADSDRGLSASFEYNSDLFDAATIERWLDGLVRLAEGVVEGPERRLSEVPLLDESERQQVLTASRTADLEDGEVGSTLCLHHLVLRQARATPQQHAISWFPEDGEAQHWTYRQLDEGSRRVASELRRLGIGPESRVAICSPRRPELLVGLLGILRSGAAYVPLDPAYPGARLEFILHDSQASVLLHHGTLPESLEHLAPAADPLPLLDLAELLGPDQGPIAAAAETAAETPGEDEPLPADHLAYLIYTSGSTGRPKGVAISHRNAATMVRWGRREFSTEQLRTVLASTSVCFDLSVYEIFLPLSVGGRVVVVDHALELPRLPAEAGVTLVNTVPSAMAQLAGSLPTSVHTVNLAGEPLVRSLVDRIYAQDSVQAVYNLYGPSEDTTYSTWVKVPADTAEEPTIGWAVSQTDAYVVDRRTDPVPRGVAGELLLSGDKLSRGYLGRPALTAERYIPDPFTHHAGGRAYRTGDLVRQRADGELEFLGRLDHQVKIRGFRIELGEIEQTLEQHPDIHKSVVMAKTLRDEPVLVAYLATGTATLESSEIRTFLAAKLPAYMVPQAFAQLPELPLTPNGKIDRKALPEPQMDGSGADFVAPSTAVEEMLVDIWREVLGVERIGIHDSFFDLGGHSLLATRVLSRVQESFGVDLPIRSLLEAPTVYGLAEAIAEHLMAGVDEETLAALMAEMDPADS